MVTMNGTAGEQIGAGDYVIVCSDVLAEVGREAVGLPPAWQFVPAGTHGKVLGWRDSRNADEPERAVVELLGISPRLVVYVGEHRVTRSTRMVEHRSRRLRRAG